MVVRINPFGSLSPGMTNLAITPAMKPMMIVQIMPISHSFPGWSGTNFPSSTIRDAAGYIRNNLEVAAGTVRLIYVNAGHGSSRDVAPLPDGRMAFGQLRPKAPEILTSGMVLGKRDEGRASAVTGGPPH